jgi:hypothetical protein
MASIAANNITFLNLISSLPENVPLGTTFFHHFVSESTLHSAFFAFLYTI